MRLASTAVVSSCALAATALLSALAALYLPAFNPYYAKTVAILSGLSLLLSVFLAAFLIKRIFAPLRTVLDSVKKAAVAMAPDEGSIDEIKTIAIAVDRLSASLKECRRCCGGLIKVLPDAVLELGPSGEVLFMNASAEGIFGPEVKKRKGGFTGLIAPAHRQTFQEMLERLKGGDSAQGVACRAETMDGRLNLFELNAVPVFLGGKVAGCRIAARDVEETKRLREELEGARKNTEETSAKLVKTIKDLEEFALLAVRREIKMQEIRERFQRLKSGGAFNNGPMQ